MSDRLTRGQSMAAGDLLRSPNKRFSAVMFPDGDLAVFEDGERLRGSVGPMGGAAEPELAVDDDGALVLRDRADGTVVHRAPHDPSGPDTELVMRDDGVLAVYAGGDVVWRPRTTGPGCADPVVGWFPGPPPSYAVTVDSFGDKLPGGDVITATRSPLPGFLQIQLTLGRNVSWWKRVTVYSGSGRPLGCADVQGSRPRDSFTVPTGELPAARLSFWKAEFLGNPATIYTIADLTGWADSSIALGWIVD
jgi:hypothetical protein